MIDRTVAGRFWPRIDTSAGFAGCWPWQGGRSSQGYGSLRVDGRARPAQVVAFELTIGPVPDGLTLDHRCHTEDDTCAGGNDCRHRLCVNPVHLEPVTIGENTIRGRGPSGVNARKTHCSNGHPFTPENTTRRVDGARECRPCNRQRQERALVRLQSALVAATGSRHPCSSCRRVFPTAKGLHIHLYMTHPGPETDALLRAAELASGRESTRRYEQRQRILRDEQAAAADL